MKVLYFSTAWCGPCKMFKPVVQQVASETGTSVQYIDAENNPLAQTYQVTSVPTILVLDNMNNIAFRNSGVMAKQQLASTFSRFK